MMTRGSDYCNKLRLGTEQLRCGVRVSETLRGFDADHQSTPERPQSGFEAGSFVGCIGSNIRRTSFSSLPSRRATSLLLMPRPGVEHRGVFGSDEDRN
jgi:hypothetical protein